MIEYHRWATSIVMESDDQGSTVSISALSSTWFDEASGWIITEGNIKVHWWNKDDTSFDSDWTDADRMTGTPIEILSKAHRRAVEAEESMRLALSDRMQDLVDGGWVKDQVKPGASLEEVPRNLAPIAPRGRVRR